MGDPKSIREMLNLQELSEEEKQARGILGRLYGPCASIVDATRNGRRYNDELWEKVFSKDNEIVAEMFANGGIPMELDHPVDREETCSEKIAAMMPEPPKRDKDGHLICYIDIIDTPCGKIAYQLAKYGFKLGISSRGTGDLYQDDNGDEVVDPDTYQFTTFDLVLLPAVKDARLSMYESLDTKKFRSNKEFKKALKEDYDNSSKEDQRIMDNTMKDLNIDIDLEEDSDGSCRLPDGTPCWEIGEGPSETNESKQPLTEKEDEAAIEETEVDVEIEDAPEEEKDEKDTKKSKSKKKDKEDKKDDKEEEDKKEESEEETEVQTVKDLLDGLKEFDKKAEVTFNPIVINDTTYNVSGISFDGDDEGKLVTIDVITDYTPETEDNIEDVAVDAPVEDLPVEANPEDVAVDDGIDAVVENFKDVVRQKDVLESEVKQLKSEKAVGDAEVKKLKEELDRYKLAFARTSELATNAKKFASEVKSLNEQLAAKDSQIKNLQKVQVSTTKLTESRDANVAKVKVLTEQLNTVKAQKENAEAELTTQLNEAKKLAKTRLDIAKGYKAKYDDILEKYIGSKASMLGVRPAEIKARLEEKFSIEDVDKVCDSMLTEGVSVNRLPYGLTASSRIKVNSSKQPATTANSENGYDVDESLLAFLND